MKRVRPAIYGQMLMSIALVFCSFTVNGASVIGQIDKDETDSTKLLDSLQSRATSTRILVSINPLRLIVELLDVPFARLGMMGEVSTLLPRGSTPHDYVLKPSDLLRVQNADLVIWMGPKVEPYLTAVIARVDKKKVVDVSQLTALHRLPVRALLDNGKPVSAETGYHSQHSHGHHAEMAFDPHIWWSIENAQVIASQVLLASQGLSNLDAENRKLINQALLGVFQPLETLLSEKKAIADQYSPSFMLFHDGLQYMEFELGVTSIARVAMGDDHQPGIKTLLALKRRVAEEQVVCVVAEPSTNLSIINKIETTPPLQRVVIDSLGWEATSYLTMLSSAYDTLLSCHR